MLKLDHISKTFNPGTLNEKKALDQVDLHLERGDFVTIVGSNGAGKSTLFNAIAGSFLVDSGCILVDGQDITFMAEHKRSKHIGRLFQDPMRGTAPHMTIEENLTLAAGSGGWFAPLTQKDRQRFRDQLALLDMGLEDRIKQPVGLLSGGQRQALTLLMATMNPPWLLLLDEHTAALDPATAENHTGGCGGKQDHHPDGHPQYAAGTGAGQSHPDDGLRPRRAGHPGGGAEGNDSV